jgi:hypothetical protein
MTSVTENNMQLVGLQGHGAEVVLLNKEIAWLSPPYRHCLQQMASEAYEGRPRCPTGAGFQKHGPNDPKSRRPTEGGQHGIRGVLPVTLTLLHMLPEQ